MLISIKNHLFYKDERVFNSALFYDKPIDARNSVNQEFLSLGINVTIILNDTHYFLNIIPETEDDFNMIIMNYGII